MAKTKSVRPPFVVGGVDTHKDLHVAAVVDENNRVLGSDFRDNPAGISADADMDGIFWNGCPHRS